MEPAWRWLSKYYRDFTQYQQGQAENQTNTNILAMGKPRTGKNYMTSFMLESLLNGGYVKAVFPHVSKPGHLSEVLQFLFPNGTFQERKVREELETLRENLEAGEYTDASVSVSDLHGLEEMDLAPRVQEVEKLLESAENDTVKNRLGKVRKASEKHYEKVEMIEKNVIENKEIPRKIRNMFGSRGATSNFSMKIFVPITFGLPEDVEVPEGMFAPFAIPVDSYSVHGDMEWGLRTIFGDRNFGGYKKLYHKMATAGDSSFADLKEGYPEGVDRDYVQEREYADGEVVEVYDPEKPKQSLKRFKVSLSQMFNSTGIVSSSDFEYDLRSQLKEALLGDEPDIVVLYTGFMKDKGAKKFVMTHFMEEYRSIIDNLTHSEEKRLTRKFIVNFIEAQEAIKLNDQDKNLSQEDVVFNRFMHEFMNESGHFNSDIWVDTKPDDAHPMLLSRTQYHFVTQISHNDLKELFAGRGKEIKDKARACFKNRDYTEMGKYGYGFIDLSRERIVEWDKGETADVNPGVHSYGYRLPCKRQCVERPVPVSNTDFSFLLDSFDVGSTTFKEYKEALFEEDWGETESQPIEREDEKLEEEKKKKQEEQQEKKDLIKQNVRERLRNMVQERGLPGTWRDYLEEIKDDMDLSYTIRSIEGWTQDLRQDLKEEAEKEPEEEIDVDEVADELKRDEKFVFGATSSDRKQMYAVDWIMDRYDCGEGYAEKVAGKAVSKAVTDLEFENVIDSSHNPQIDDREEFRELMDLDEEEDGEGDDG